MVDAYTEQDRLTQQLYGPVPGQQVNPYGAPAPAPYDPSQVIQGYFAPQQAIADQQSQINNQKYINTQAANQSQQDYLNQQADLMLRQLAVKDQSIGNQYTTLNRQGSLMGQMADVQKSRFQTDQDAISRQVNYLQGLNDLQFKSQDLQDAAARRNIGVLGSQMHTQGQRFALDEASTSRQISYINDLLGYQQERSAQNVMGINREKGTLEQVRPLDLATFAAEHDQLNDLAVKVRKDADVDLHKAQSEATIRGALISQGYARNIRVIDDNVRYAFREIGRRHDSSTREQAKYELNFRNQIGKLDDALANNDIDMREYTRRYNENVAQLNDKLYSIQLDKQDYKTNYDEGVARLNDQLAQGQINREEYGIKFQEMVSGLNDKSKELQYSQQEYDINYAGQLGQLDDQRKALDIMSQENGLSKEEVIQKLDYGIAQLGLSGSVSSLDLLQAQVDLQAGRFNPYQDLLRQVMQYGGLQVPNQ